jgi:hypothetical protein
MALGVASSDVSNNNYTHSHSGRCITDSPAPEETAKLNKEIETFANRRSTNGLPDAQTIVIPTYFVM